MYQKTAGQTTETLAPTVLQVSRATAIMLIIAYVVYVWFMGHTVSHEISTTRPLAGTPY